VPGNVPPLRPQAPHSRRPLPRSPPLPPPTGFRGTGREPSSLPDQGAACSSPSASTIRPRRRWLPHCCSLPSPPGDQLADDADSDFLRGLGADIETDRGDDPLPLAGIKPFLFQGFQQGLTFAPAPEQADEARPGCQTPPHGIEIRLMAGCGNDDNFFRPELQPGKSVKHRPTDNQVGTREQLVGCAFGAFVNHNHPETAAVCQSGYCPPHMAGAEHYQQRTSSLGLDVDRHAAAAGKAVFRSQDEFEIPGSLIRKCFQGSLDGFLFDTPSADSAEKAAVTVHQHLGSCLAGRRTAAGSDCGQYKSLTPAGEAYHLLVQFQVKQMVTPFSMLP